MPNFIRPLLLLVIVYSPVFIRAQSIENIKVSIGALEDGVKKYFFTYDLIASHANIPCLVQVKLTTANSTRYLKLVKGDVGNLVLPGNNKQFVWDFEEELINFSGTENTFAIEVYPNVTVSSKVKRSKKLTVNMDDIFSKDKNYTIILYRHEQEVIRLAEMALSQNAVSLIIPRKTKVRKDYQLCITDGEQKFFSNTFKVKPKIGTFWKVLPFLIVPIYLNGQKYLDDNKELPGVPDSPSN